MAAAEPIRDRRHIKEISAYFLKKGETRNNVLFIVGIYTGLRISDILNLKWDSVYDFERDAVKKYITVTEKKTGKSKTVTLNVHVIKALKKYKNAAKAGKPIFINAHTGKSISRVQAYRIISAASEAVNSPVRFSCHSLRKTLGYHSWKSGVSPVLIMAIYNHSSFNITRSYLGILQDDKNAVYKNLKLL